MAALFDMTMQRRINRRTVLRGGAAGAGAVAGAFLLACSGDDDGGSDSSTGDSSSQGQAKQGGVLRMGQTADITVTEPHRIGQSQGTILWPLFEPVITLDQQFKPKGVLAESWELTPDNLQMTLKLQKNVTYHTGRPFTSADVKWNIERVQDPNAPFAQFRAVASKFTSVATPDANTVSPQVCSPTVGHLRLL